MKEFAAGVSYAKFAALAKRMEWRAEYLAERFRGTLDARDETLPHYFARVLACDPSFVKCKTATLSIHIFGQNPSPAKSDNTANRYRIKAAYVVDASSPESTMAQIGKPRI